MTLLARRRDEPAREQVPEEIAEERRGAVVRPRPLGRGFLHLQAAVGNRATGGLLGAGAFEVEERRGEAPPGFLPGAAPPRFLPDEGRRGDLVTHDLAPVAELARNLRARASASHPAGAGEEAARAPSGLLVADGTKPGPGQMARGDFLRAIRDAAGEAAEEGLAPVGHSARGCPWIGHYFRYYRRQSAERIEADLGRWVPAARAAASADELLAAATEHVRASVARWAASGELTGLPRGLPGMGLVASVQAALGRGRPLPASERGRMERALGTRLNGVRLHTGAAAVRLARRLRARAFAVGRDVAFGRGEYRPGTPVGDALLAHELAHTVQQRGAGAGTAAAVSGRRAEGDAVAASAGALARLWAGGRALAGDLARGARPRLRTGLALAACRETFSEQELKTYLEKLRTKGIEGGFVGDNKARAVVRANREKPGTFPLEDVHVQRMIEEMLKGWTLQADEEAILELLRQSGAARLKFLFTAGGLTPKALLDKIGGERETALKKFFEERFEGGLRAVQAGKVVPIPDADLAEVPAGLLDRPEGATRFLTEAADRIAAETGEVRKRLAAGDPKAHEVVDQKRVAGWLKNVRTAYETLAERLGSEVAEQAPLRAAYVRALDQVREAASAALAAAGGLDEATVARERAAYAENSVAWIEASPMTSTGLAAQRDFDAADVAVAGAYEKVLERYLDQLLAELPTLQLTQEQKDRIHARLLAALRRAYLTVGEGAAGRIDVRAVTDPGIAKKYRRVTAYLAEESRGPQMDLITSSPSLELYDFDIATVKSNLDNDPRIGEIDLRHVPPDERDYVYYGLMVIENTTFPGTTIQLKNAIWPVTMEVRRGDKTVRVRYELIFDEHSNVRVERLGEADPRQVPAEFSRLSVAGKKAALVKEFGLAAVDDRPGFTPPPGGLAPAVPGPGAPAPAAPGPRPERKWSTTELDQLKGALDLLPAGERPILRGVTLVRDHKHPSDPDKTAGTFQSSESKELDEPGPPAHPPPHIHYYDLAFEKGFSATGAPGASGPGVEHTLLHEIGHLRIGRAFLAASAAVNAANQRSSAAHAALTAAVKGSPMNKVKIDAWNAWLEATRKASTAHSDYADAVKEFGQKSNKAQKSDDPFPDPATLQPKQAAVEVALRTSAQKVAGLAKVGVPKKLRTAAAEIGAALEAQFKAWQQYVADDRQIPIFATLARRFGFHVFTDYARSGGEGEWFAETYSLYVTDPDRLNAMSPKLFAWFEAGMPMDPQWEPPPAGEERGK